MTPISFKFRELCAGSPRNTNSTTLYLQRLEWDIGDGDGNAPSSGRLTETPRLESRASRMSTGVRRQRKDSSLKEI